KGQEVVNAIEQNDQITKVNILRKGKAAEGFDGASIFKFKVENFAKEQQAKESAALDGFKKMMAEKYPNAKSTPTGLMYVMEKEGTGKQATAGSTVRVHYTGKL